MNGRRPLYSAQWVLSKDEGTPDMTEVSDAIREGADGFFAVQYSLIGKLAGHRLFTPPQVKRLNSRLF